MTTQRYRKLPVEIEAMEWDGTFVNAQYIVEWILVAGEDAWYFHLDNQIRISTLEGVMSASPGDFIIKGVAGEFYACKPDIFFKTYEPA